MELELTRVYYPSGTNGMLLHKDKKICNTIELPWKDNQPQISCIPEGRYQLIICNNLKFKQHLEVLDVPGREWILIHPANNAETELKGCIAPVDMLTAPGKGVGSRQAMERLKLLANIALAAKEPIFLTIKSGEYESI